LVVVSIFCGGPKNENTKNISFVFLVVVRFLREAKKRHNNQVFPDYSNRKLIFWITGTESIASCADDLPL
jgi:hypothetical protein